MGLSSLSFNPSNSRGIQSMPNPWPSFGKHIRTYMYTILKVFFRIRKYGFQVSFCLSALPQFQNVIHNSLISVLTVEIKTAHAA